MVKKSIVNNRLSVHYEVIDKIIQEAMGLAHRCVNRPVYWKPYLDYIDRMNYPRNFKPSYFNLFSVEDNQSTIEHASHFIMQCREVVAKDMMKSKLFAHSLSDFAFIGTQIYCEISFSPSKT